SEDAVGDFFLHHEDEAIEVLMTAEQLQENVGGDVVGNIANDARGFHGAPGSAVGEKSRLVSKKRRNLDTEEIAFDDFEVGQTAIFEAHLCGEDVIELDGDEASSTIQEDFGQC